MGLDSLADSELLRSFRERRDEDAFRELVRRYLGLVLQVAQRRTGQPQSAEEIAQNVFLKLARKARQLDPESVLGAWLHRVTVQEAIDFHRREYRRRRAMKTYQQDRISSDRTEVDDLPPEVLDNLDEALTKLSDSDRSALMLRFHGGLRFRELAVRLGKSEDAVRKQVARALKKLSLRLRRSTGAGVPVTALASGLGLALGQKTSASSALVTTIAQGALASNSIPVSSFLLTNVMVLMKSKLIIAGLVMVLAAFVGGRRTAASFEKKLLAQSYQSSIQRAALAQVAQVSIPDEMPGLVGRSVPEIMAEAAEVAEAQNTGAYYELQLLLSELKPHEYREAIEHLELSGLSQGVFERIGISLVGFWASEDGAAAMDWVDEHLSESRSNAPSRVLRAWSAKDPEAAYARYQAMAEDNDGTRDLYAFRWLAKSVFEGWVHSDPAGAVAALEAVSVEDEDGALFGIAEAVPAAADPEAILGAVERMSLGRTRAQLIRRVASEWAAEEPHAAAAWIDQVADLTTEERLAAKGQIAEAWMRYDSSDAVSIGAWFLSGAPDSRREELRAMVDAQIARIQQK